MREIDCPDCLGCGETELPCLNSLALEPRMGACETCGGAGWIFEDDRESWFDTTEEANGER